MNLVSGAEIFKDYSEKLKSPECLIESRLADKLRGYVYDAHSCFVTYVTYRVWQAVKSLFGNSDWQQAKNFLKVSIRRFDLSNYCRIDIKSSEFIKYRDTFVNQIFKYEFTKLKLAYQLRDKSVVDVDEVEEKVKIPHYRSIQSHFIMNCPKIDKS